MQSRFVGESVPRKDGLSKVTGKARYVDDLAFPGMLHGATVRSPLARGAIRGIAFHPSIAWHEYVVATAEDVPGDNRVHAIRGDQPLLASDAVNHAEEAVLLVAHADPAALERARRAITIEIDPLPAVFTIEDSEQQSTIVWGSDNTFQSYNMTKGDVDAAWTRPDVVVVEGEYRTGAQEHLYIEPQGVIAVANPEDGVTVWGSMQCPYYVHRALAAIFQLPAGQVRVIQTETGGGFGGKEDYPSLIAGHAALLAWKSGRPVKIVYDRTEDMAATTKRHPSRTRHRTAVTRDGKLVAIDIDFALDGGAYTTLSPVVLSRGTIHAAGPYDCPNVRVRSRAVATNTPPHGAFRGFGAPQSIFALERHLDHVARAVGLTPDELRRRNFVRQGGTLATGQVVREDVDLDGLLTRALLESDFHARRQRFARENASGKVKRGMGLACFLHGAGFTGSGERTLGSVAGVEITSEGRVRVLAASTEIGQGARTVFAQIAADALGVSYECIDVPLPDTAEVPNSGPTVASRTTMVVGKLVEEAALSLRQTLVDAGLLASGYTSEEFARAAASYDGRLGPLKRLCRYQEPPDIHWDDEHYRGDAYGTFAWAAYVAQVAVDMVTYQARVEDFVAVQEVGRVVHPALARGQIEGGIAQGIGWALYEDVVWHQGRMTNSRMTNYIIPTAADLGSIRVFFEERPYAYGPGGAKGLGELPMDGPAPAILNAIEDAIGVSLSGLPATPERILEALEAQHG